MIRAMKHTTAAALALVLMAGLAPAHAAPVLANGDFEAVFTPSPGNNFGASFAAPWQVVSGNANVINVDGAGPYVYAPSFPANDVDASNPGAVPQHYFDVAGGGSEFFQVFTPLCTGEVRYGAAFSFADESVAGSGAQPGVAGITIKLASDGSVVVPRQNISISGGNTASNPWSSFAFSASLTAGTTYSYWVDMNDWAAMDNAFVTFESNCPEHNEEDIVDVDPPKPQLCTAFTPEVTCDTATGQTVVTLTNSASGFDPAQIAIVSQTGGVTAQQSQSDPLQVLLTGAQAGQNISLWVDAVETGGGSLAGLDACCMGEMSVQIPKDYVCEKPPEFTVTKTCAPIDSPVREMQCRIDVQYSGPPPSPPISVSDTLTGTGATLTGTPTSTDNWACTGTSPASCTIDAASDPSIDWDNFTSTIVFDVRYDDDFENCAKGVAAGIEDEACWSSREPELTLTKTANQAQCNVGAPCTFTITVTNPSTAYFNGPLTLSDHVISGAGQGGQFSDITPALCNPNDIATTGLCSGNASIPAGGSQAYTVTWIPPLGNHGEDYEALNCAGVSSAGGQMGYPFDPSNGGDGICATVDVGPSLLTITKTGPAICAPNGSCTYQVTTTNTGSGAYSRPLMLVDSAPSGYHVTGVSGPATVQGCGAGLPGMQLACVYSVPIAAGAFVTHAITISSILPSTAQTLSGQNCAALAALPATAQTGDFSGQSLGGNPALAGATLLGQSCVPVRYDPPPPPPPTGGDLSIDKTCAPAVAGPMGLDIACTITISANGPWPAGGINVTETLAQNLSPNDTGASITTLTWPDMSMFMNIGPVAPATPKTTSGFSDQFTSGTTVLNASVHLANEGYLSEADNCASVQGFDANGDTLGTPVTDCATFTPPATARIASQPPAITVTKTADGPCVPDAQKKTATCAFTITATNTGDQPYVGPLVVTDVFKGPVKVISATASTDGLECRADTKAAHCLSGDADIPAKEAFIILLTTKVRMEYAPTTFENCGELGTAGDGRVQAMVAQTALKALGKYQGGIDGQFGRQSRAALTALQTELGLTANGQVDDGLMTALGIPAGGDAACVTVDIPVRPEPPPKPKAQCDRATTVAQGGDCVCRFKNMFEMKNGVSCGCVKGTKFVAGKGCIKPRSVEPEKPVVSGPRCDRASARAQGGKCVCLNSDLLPISKTACAPKRNVKHDCPKGEVFIKGLGCVNEDIYFGESGGDEKPRP